MLISTIFYNILEHKKPRIHSNK